MPRTLTLIIASAAAAGCAKHLPLNAASAATLRGREIAITRHAVPDFLAQTPGKAMFGALGAVAMVSAGNQIVQANGVEDPAEYIAGQLSADLSRRSGTRVSPERIALSDDDDEAIARRPSRADLVMDVTTNAWSFAYYPLAWGRYRVIYAASLRLIDKRTAEVIARGRCSRDPPQTASSRTYEELLADGARRLKDELRAAAQACIGELQAKVLVAQ